jgi:hypothetical protein
MDITIGLGIRFVIQPVKPKHIHQGCDVLSNSHKTGVFHHDTKAFFHEFT